MSDPMPSTSLPRRLLVLASVLAVAACATPPHPLARPDGPYGEQLLRSTRSRVLARGLDNVLVAHVTEEDPSYVRARAERLASLWQLPAEVAVQRAGELAAPVEGTAFFIALHASERENNDLAEREPHWSLLVEQDGRTLPALTVRKLVHGAATAALFPQMDRHFTAYRVVFPAIDTQRSHQFIITGAPGALRLAFGPGAENEP